MKKFDVVLPVFCMIFLSSCSNVVDEPALGGDIVEVQLTATVAGNVSRAVAAGENVDQITYAIYRQDKDGSATKVTGPLALYGDTDVQKTDALTGSKYSLTVSLARNEVYTVVFWADKKVTVENAKQPYTFDATNKKITIDYDGALANDDSRDAFYGAATITAGVDVAPTVELRRRFTLVNLLTNDSTKYATASAAAGYDKSYIKVSKAAKELNLLDGSVASDVENVTFAINGVPKDKSPMTDYSYLAYALVASPQATLADVSYGVADGVALNTINNVPLKQNYRTNIYGSLLTSSSTIDVSVVAGFNEPDLDLPVVTTPQDLVNAIVKSGGAVIPDGVTIDVGEILGDYSADIDEPTTIVLNGDIVCDEVGQFNVFDKLTICGTGTITSSVRGLFFVQKGGSMDVSNVTINTTNPRRGSGIYCEGAESITLKNVTFNSAYCTIQVYSGDETEVEINDCVINSYSSTLQYGKSAYALNFLAGNVVIENCTGNAVQGALAVVGTANVVVKSGSFATHDSEYATERGQHDAFAAAYVSGDGVLTVYDGSFYSPRENYAVLCGDNDVDTPYGTAILYGGKYSDKPFDSNKGREYAIEPAAGYKYVETGDETYPWAVVKE